MPKITIFTTQFCSYCDDVKTLLNTKNIFFEEIDVTTDLERRAEMKIKAGGRNSVPQIFIDHQHIGGCDDLHELDSRGELDKLLNLSC